MYLVQISSNCTVKLVYNNHPWDPNIVTGFRKLVVVQRYLDDIKVQIRTTKWW